MKKLQILFLFVMLALASALSIKAQTTPPNGGYNITISVWLPQLTEPSDVAAYIKAVDGTLRKCPLVKNENVNGWYDGGCSGLATYSVQFFTVSSNASPDEVKFLTPESVLYGVSETHPPQPKNKRFRMPVLTP